MNLVDKLIAKNRRDGPEDSSSRANRLISEMNTRFISATELTNALRDLEYEINRICIINNVFDICRVLQEIRMRCTFTFCDEYFVEYVTHIFGCSSYTYRRTSFVCELSTIDNHKKMNKLKTSICYDCWAKFLYERDITEDLCTYHSYRNKYKEDYGFISKAKRFFRLKR